MEYSRNIVSRNKLYLAKLFWPDWPENGRNQVYGQVKMAGKWPDTGVDLLLIAVLIAVLSDGLVRILQNGSLRHSRIAVFIVKQSFSVLINVSYRTLTKVVFSSQGHSIGHFVLDSYSVLQMYFYRTFLLLKSTKSYLMVKLKNIGTHIINNCISMTCLFDGYLIDNTYYPYKTPKPLDQSGFFSFLFFKRYQVELVQSQRDETFVIGPNVQKLSSRGATLKTCL